MIPATARATQLGELRLGSCSAASNLQIVLGLVLAWPDMKLRCARSLRDRIWSWPIPDSRGPAALPLRDRGSSTAQREPARCLLKPIALMRPATSGAASPIGERAPTAVIVWGSEKHLPASTMMAVAAGAWLPLPGVAAEALGSAALRPNQGRHPRPSVFFAESQDRNRFVHMSKFSLSVCLLNGPTCRRTPPHPVANR
jgi:hypothetical protein